jgi:hypothetical protein
MRFYWSLSRIPELRGLSASQRRLRHRSVYRVHILQAAPVKWGAAYLFGMFVGSGVLLWLGGCLTESFWIRSLLAGLGAGAGGFIVEQFAVEHLRPFYRDAFQDAK